MSKNLNIKNYWTILWFLSLLIVLLFIIFGNNPPYLKSQSTGSQSPPITLTASSQTPYSMNVIGSGSQYYQLAWNVTGTISACSLRVDSSSDGVTWNTGDIISTQSCTSNPLYAPISAQKVVNYVRINPNSTITGTGTIVATLTGFVTYIQNLTPNSTVGTAGFWSHSSRQFGYINNTTTVIPLNNLTLVYDIYPDFPQVIGHFTVDVTTAGTAENLTVCLYDNTGNNLLWNANTPVTSTGAQTGTAAQYTLIPNSNGYMIAYEQNGTTGATYQGYGSSAPIANILNKNGIRVGTSANSITGTTCPASLGTITPQTTVVYPALALEP